jgi:hypothetical protein
MLSEPPVELGAPKAEEPTAVPEKAPAAKKKKSKK